MHLVWAIANKMVQEALRKRTLVALLLFLVPMILCLPVVLKSDGTLKGQLQLTLSYSLYACFLMLIFLTIFLVTTSVTGEIQQKHFYLIDTKPVARWQFLAGKFVGLALLNIRFLIIIGLTVWVMMRATFYFHNNEEEKRQVAEEMFSCYESSLPYVNMEKLRFEVDQEYERLVAQKKLPDNHNESEAKQQLQQEKLDLKSLIPYRSEAVWIFKEIPAGLKQDPRLKLKLRYKLFVSETAYGSSYQARWQIGRGDNRYLYQTKTKPGEFLEFTIPISVIEDNNTVEVRFIHLEPAAGFIFIPIQNSLELLYPGGRFWGNYLRGFFLFFLVLGFLTLVALFASTFLTFPVAILLTLFILFVGAIAHFLFDLLLLGAGNLAKEPQQLLHAISQRGLALLFTLIPNFATYNPISYLSTGRLIDWALVFDGILQLLVVRGGILALLSCLIFYYREIGRPVE